MSEFDLVGDHFAIYRVFREQRDHHVGLANLACDLSRPFFSNCEMAIDEYVMAARAELRLQPIQNVLIWLPLAFVQDGNAQRRKHWRGGRARLLCGSQRRDSRRIGQIAREIPVRHICELLEAFDGVLLCDFVRRVVRCAIACGLDSTDFIVHAPRHRGVAFLEHAKHLRKKIFDAFLPRRAFDRQSLPEITQQKLDHNTIIDAGGLRGAADVFKRRRKIDAQ